MKAQLQKVHYLLPLGCLLVAIGGLALSDAFLDASPQVAAVNHIKASADAIYHDDPNELVKTTYASAYLRWTALFVLLCAAWIANLVLALRVILRIRQQLAQPMVRSIRWSVTIVLLLGLGLAFLDHMGGLPFTTGMELPEEPKFTGVRNYLGWATGSVVVMALSCLLLSRACSPFPRRAQSLRRLMFCSTISLSVGVAQIHALFRVVIVQRVLGCQSPDTCTGLKVAILPSHLIDLETSLTMAIAIVFSILIAACFVPVLLVFETERSEQKEPGDSFWRTAGDAVMLILPLASGLVFAYGADL